MAESKAGYALMKYWHDEAYKLLSQALDLDEKGGGKKKESCTYRWWWYYYSVVAIRTCRR